MKYGVSDSDPLLTVEQAAQRLGVSESTLWRMIRSGRIQSVRKGGRRFIPTSSLRVEQRVQTDEVPPLTLDNPLFRMIGMARGPGEGAGSEDKRGALFGDSNSGDKYGLGKLS